MNSITISHIRGVVCSYNEHHMPLRNSSTIYGRCSHALLGAVGLLAIAIVAVLIVACDGVAAPTSIPEQTTSRTPIPTLVLEAGTLVDATPTHTPRPLTLPADEALHGDPVEWWYYSGIMEDERGSRYGFHFVVFQARDPQTGNLGYMSHASVMDVGAVTREQAVQFGIGGQAQPESGFDLRFFDWTLKGDDGRHSFSASLESYTFDLTVNATKPAALHNEVGYLAGLGGWTYYYSWTRMDLSGTLTTGGQELTVTGHAWMDHQWGDFVVEGYPTGWQWFSLSMDSGHELMVTETREADGDNIIYGTLISPSGMTTHIEEEDIAIDVLGSWTSPHTGGEYPAGWDISIPRQGLSAKLTPILDDQEFTLAFPRSRIYWEGLVETEITFNGGRVGGSGYVELVGYVPPLQ